jgi:hypothetical protein
MGFLEEKLNDSQTRDFIIREINFSSESDKERKTRVITLTKVEIEGIFKGLRPRSIDYTAFSDIRKILGAELKDYLRGDMVHLSKVSDALWNEYTKDMKYKPLQKGKTYVKKRENTETSSGTTK